MNFNAPIIITVYNRADHLRKCIEALLQCREANNTILYISSDAAKVTAHANAIEEVRNYISTIKGFASVIPVYHEQNKGLLYCYQNLIEKVLKEHDAFIFLEDDVLVAPDFIAYMNSALSFYSSNKRVFSISAFSFSVFYQVQPDKRNEVYFVNRFYPWGFAMWKDRYQDIPSYNLQHVKDSFDDAEFIERLKVSGADLLPAFHSLVAQGRMFVLDYLNTYHMVKNNLVTVVPYISKSFNIGHDGSGDRTTKAEHFLKTDVSFLKEVNPVRFTNNIDQFTDNQFNQKHFKNSLNNVKILLNKLGLLGLVMKLVNKYRGK